MNYPAFFARNLLQTHSRSLQNPKPCPIQIFTHLNTGTSRRDKKDKWLSVIRGEFFWGGAVCRPFWKVLNIFPSTCPNRSGVGAIDNPDRFEQDFSQYYIPEDPEKIFMHDISMVRRQKMSIFDVLKTFISKITYYKLY